MQEPIQERGGRCRGLGRSPGNGSGDGSLLGGSRHDLTPTHEGIVPSTDRAGWGRSISVQRGNKVILSVAAIGNQTRWSESSPSPASFQRILVSDSLCREGTRPNASFSWKAEIVGSGKLTLASTASGNGSAAPTMGLRKQLSSVAAPGSFAGRRPSWRPGRGNRPRR